MNAFLLIKPVITEKSLALAQTKSAFTFEVARTATKDQISTLVAQLYSVDVRAVNTIMGHKSLKSAGAKRLKRAQSKVKKAIVTLKPGQTIEVFDIQGAPEATQA